MKAGAVTGSVAFVDSHAFHVRQRRAGVQANAQQKDVLRPESRIELQQGAKAARKEYRRRKEHARDRHLRDDEQLPRPSVTLTIS